MAHLPLLKIKNVLFIYMHFQSIVKTVSSIIVLAVHESVLYGSM